MSLGWALHFLWYFVPLAMNFLSERLSEGLKSSAINSDTLPMTSIFSQLTSYAQQYHLLLAIAYFPGQSTFLLKLRIWEFFFGLQLFLHNCFSIPSVGHFLLCTGVIQIKYILLFRPLNGSCLSLPISKCSIIIKKEIQSYLMWRLDFWQLKTSGQSYEPRCWAK